MQYKKESLPERILYMALENVAYDESRAILLITKMLKDDTNTAKKVSAAAYTLFPRGVWVFRYIPLLTYIGTVPYLTFYCPGILGCAGRKLTEQSS